MAIARFLVAVVLAGTLSPSVWADAVERMGMEKLRATHERVESLKKELRKVTLESGYDDVRALLHVHSAFSHDSRGTIDEIVAAAKKVGVRVIMFSEHPANHYDYVNDGHRGLKDGVLLIPGAETKGFLAYPKRSIQNEKSEGPQEFSCNGRHVSPGLAVQPFKRSLHLGDLETVHGSSNAAKRPRIAHDSHGSAPVVPRRCRQSGAAA